MLWAVRRLKKVTQGMCTRSWWLCAWKLSHWVKYTNTMWFVHKFGQHPHTKLRVSRLQNSESLGGPPADRKWEGTFAVFSLTILRRALWEMAPVLLCIDLTCQYLYFRIMSGFQTSSAKSSSNSELMCCGWQSVWVHHGGCFADLFNSAQRNRFSYALSTKVVECRTCFSQIKPNGRQEECCPFTTHQTLRAVVFFVQNEIETHQHTSPHGTGHSLKELSGKLARYLCCLNNFLAVLIKRCIDMRAQWSAMEHICTGRFKSMPAWWQETHTRVFGRRLMQGQGFDTSFWQRSRTDHGRVGTRPFCWKVFHLVVFLEHTQVSKDGILCPDCHV